MPGSFKLEGLQPVVKPILFPKSFKFFRFHTGRLILITPERVRVIMGKLNYTNLREAQGIECLWHSNWIRCRPIN